MAAAVTVRRARWNAPSAEADSVMYRYARRGIVLQVGLRALLVGFVIATLILLPPAVEAGAAWAVAALYAVASAVSSIWLLRGGPVAIRYGFLVLYGDLVAVTALTLLAAMSAVDSWTSEVLLRGLFVIPVLAATQFRAGVCAAVAYPAAGVYLLDSLLTQQANAEPLESVLLRSVIITGIAVAAVTLSDIQRSRVEEIAALLRSQTALLAEVTGLEQRERRVLAEQLHDGALQYVLSARHDLEDARDTGDSQAFDRLDQALTASAGLLRGTVADLHPAVLEQAGLVAALQPLLSAAADRAGVLVELQAEGWPIEFRSGADDLLYSTARELIANVVKHAAAQSVTVRLHHDAGSATMVIADDGVGLDQARLDRRLAEGHVGLASQRVRIEAAGGTITLGNTTTDGGTTVTVTVPLAAAGSLPPAR